MRLVDHQDILVPMQYIDGKRYGNLFGRFAIRVHHRTGGQPGAGGDAHTRGIDHLAAVHLIDGGRTESGHQLVNHSSAVVKPDSHRPQTVSHR